VDSVLLSKPLLGFELHQEHGATLTLVTHDPQLAARCDRQLVLAGGRLE